MQCRAAVVSFVWLFLITSFLLVSYTTVPPAEASHPATAISAVAYANDCVPQPSPDSCDPASSNFGQTLVNDALGPDSTIGGAAPSSGLVQDDLLIKFRDTNGDSFWIAGPSQTGGGQTSSSECVFRDSNSNGIFDTGESLGGTCPGSGTVKDDPKIKYLDGNNNSIRDGTELVFYDFNDNGVAETGTITFTTDIIMYNIVDVSSWQVKVAYDKSKLLVRSATLGTFWSDAGGSMFPSIDNNVGTAVWGMTLLGGASLTDPGPQLMAAINWRVADEGASNIHLVTDVEDPTFGVKIKDSVEVSELYNTEDGFVSTTDAIPLSALPDPEFTITPNPAPEGSSIAFDAAASSNLLNYDWTFGDGSTGIGIMTNHVYASACNAFLRPRPIDSDGCYRAVLTGTTAGALSANATKIVIVQPLSNQPPVLQPIGDKTTDELTELRFTASASDPDGDQLSFSLGTDSPTGASIDPTLGIFTWRPTEAQGPGTYPVTIIVSDSIDTDSETIQITVSEINSSPVLSLPPSPQYASVGDTLTFTVTANDPDTPQNTITMSATGLAAQMSFNPSTGVFSFTPDSSQNGQTFTVTFNAIDDGSPPMSDVAPVTIIVDTPPLALFTSDKTVVARQESIGFDATASSDPDGTIASYSWDFGDGETATGSTTSHSYATLGVFTVVLTVTDDLGATGTHSAVITVVNRSPLVSVTADKLYAALGESITLSITASDSDGTVQTTKIDWGDATTPETFTGPISSATHTYGTRGAFSINVTVTDNEGMSASRLQTVTISDPPTLSLMPNVPTAQTGTAIALAINSNDPDGTVETTRIDWGDGTTPETFAGAISIATHAYANAGTYTITVTVTDDDGITTSKTTSVAISAPSAFPLPGGPIPWIVVAGVVAVGVVFALVRRRGKAQPAA